eukprot:Polyplicarium_translucidae@DN3077_c0_g1_i3.p1
MKGETASRELSAANKKHAQLIQEKDAAAQLRKDLKASVEQRVSLQESLSQTKTTFSTRLEQERKEALQRVNETLEQLAEQKRTAEAAEARLKEADSQRVEAKKVQEAAERENRQRLEEAVAARDAACEEAQKATEEAQKATEALRLLNASRNVASLSAEDALVRMVQLGEEAGRNEMGLKERIRDLERGNDIMTSEVERMRQELNTERQEGPRRVDATKITRDPAAPTVGPRKAPPRAKRPLPKRMSSSLSYESLPAVDALRSTDPVGRKKEEGEGFRSNAILALREKEGEVLALWNRVTEKNRQLSRQQQVLDDLLTAITHTLSPLKTLLSEDPHERSCGSCQKLAIELRRIWESSQQTIRPILSDIPKLCQSPDHHRLAAKETPKCVAVQVGALESLSTATRMCTSPTGSSGACSPAAAFANRRKLERKASAPPAKWDSFTIVSKVGVQSIPMSVDELRCSAAPGAPPAKALIVGCAYHETSCHPLPGASNDVFNWCSFLTLGMGVESRAIRAIADSTCIAGLLPSCQPPAAPNGRVSFAPHLLAAPPPNLPTRSNILRHLDWLVQGVAPGQTVLFVFSGYGTQKRFQCSPPAQPQPGGAPSGTNRLKGRSPEMQGYLVPQDFIDKNDLSKLISSRDLMSKLAKLPAGSRAVTVLDCCHGGLLPAVGGEDCSFSAVSHRPAPPSRAAVCRASRSSVFPRYLDVNEGKRAGGPVSTDQQPPPALPKIKCSICSISCTNSSTNCEAFIEGTWQGMLSWSLVKCLSRQKGIPSSEVLESHLSEDFVKMRKVFFVEAIPEVRASPGEECEDAGSPAATEATVPVAA